MSSTLGTDLIAVERSGTVYKETKTDWDTAVSAAGSSSTNGIVIKMFWCMNTVGYNASGRHRYGTGGTMYTSRTDSSGCYTRSSSTSQNSGPYQRPNTKVKVDGTWYSIGTIGTSIGGSSAVGPMNVYYKRSVLSWSYTSAEMDTATGATSGSIQGISLQSYSAPTGSYNAFPSFGISLKTHNVTATTTNYSSQTFTHNNYFNSSYSYSTSTDAWNDFSFNTAVSWS